MRFIKSVLAGCFVLTFLVTNASAGEFYTGLDGAVDRIHIADTEFKPLASKIRLGYQFSTYAFELHYGQGTSSDDVNQLNVTVDQQAALYFRVNYYINPQARMYLLLGAAQTDINVSGPLGTGPDQYGDFSYAFGIEDYFPGVKSMQLLLEYAQLYNDKDLKIDALSLGLRYNF